HATHQSTTDPDKAYDARTCVATMREHGVTPHVAQKSNGRRSAIDRRTPRHPGYGTSQRSRKRVEEVFGWLNAVGEFRRTRYRGLSRPQLAGVPGSPAPTTWCGWRDYWHTQPPA